MAWQLSQPVDDKWVFAPPTIGAVTVKKCRPKEIDIRWIIDEHSHDSSGGKISSTYLVSMMFHA